MAAFLFKIFFDDLGDFFDCVRFCFTPDVVSLFRGEWGDDQWGEFKLLLFLGLSAGVGFMTNYSLHKWLD